MHERGWQRRRFTVGGLFFGKTDLELLRLSVLMRIQCGSDRRERCYTVVGEVRRGAGSDDAFFLPLLLAC